MLASWFSTVRMMAADEWSGLGGSARPSGDAAIVSAWPTPRVRSVLQDAADRLARCRRPALTHAAAAASVLVAAAIGYPLERFASVHDVALVLLMAVMFAALRLGMWPAVTASALSVAVYDFFFLPPVYSFSIANPSDAVTLICLLAAALIVSSLAAETRRQTEHLDQRFHIISALYAFSRKVVGIGALEELLDMTAGQLAEAVESDAEILLPEQGRLASAAASAPIRPLDAEEMAAALACWRRSEPAIAGASLLLPLRGQEGAIGVARIVPRARLTPSNRALLEALADQAATAIARIRLAETVESARLQAETERLRSALLTSVSHDLRTPLTYIIGALTSLRSYGDHFDAETRATLIATAEGEAERLDRHVGNLLDMTRLESGALNIQLDSVLLDEAVSAALSRAEPLIPHHRLDVRLPDAPIFVTASFTLLEQLLFNLLDNAGKYAPAGTEIAIEVLTNDSRVEISVGDEGAGIPALALDAIFDRATRFASGGEPGTGLGLAICRGFATAMGGTIAAANRTDRRGAAFTLTLNRASEPHVL